METSGQVKLGNKVAVRVRAYKGDATTLLAFDLHPSFLKGFVGFSIQVIQGTRKPYFLMNRLAFPNEILKKNEIDKWEKLSSEYSPFQVFRWVHVPNTDHFIGKPFYGQYTYKVTPRYLENEILKPLDETLTASASIDVSPFQDGEVQIGFTRAFISSQAYARQFNNNVKLRPNDKDLVFDVKSISGSIKKLNKKTNQQESIPYTFEDQHKYLGWQARDRILEFLDEVLQNGNLKLDVFAYDLNEPVVIEKLIKLAEQSRLRVILDDAGEHKKEDSYENAFEVLFKQKATGNSSIFRGHYQSLAHSKVMIQRDNNATAKAIKVLTGSTNFTTNGMYVNANHVVIFNNKKVAQSYADAFDVSFSKNLMSTFSKSPVAAGDFNFKGGKLPDTTLRFSPHPKTVTDQFFSTITNRILGATSDVLFAIMDDDSESTILSAVNQQVEGDKVFTYGITDNTSRIKLYKPGAKKGIKVSGKGTETKLPPPFNEVATISGHNIHHKFIVVDFRGANSVVYCGSSNLAYTPEQKNGDNLIEIRDNDAVTAFAIEAIRLVDHFQWRNKEATTEKQVDKNGKPMEVTLSDNKDPNKLWYQKHFDEADMYCRVRKLLISKKGSK
ncbi:MAG: phospholipase D-like domain-containing protein [Anaerolineales bacterium]